MIHKWKQTNRQNSSRRREQQTKHKTTVERPIECTVQYKIFPHRNVARQRAGIVWRVERTSGVEDEEQRWRACLEGVPVSVPSEIGSTVIILADLYIKHGGCLDMVMG